MSAVLIRSLKESLYTVPWFTPAYLAHAPTAATGTAVPTHVRLISAAVRATFQWRLRIDQVPFMGSVLFVLFVLFVDLACR
jgi:hypothetical protein